MQLVLTRKYHDEGTNGILRCEGEEICQTIELPWKNNRYGSESGDGGRVG